MRDKDLAVGKAYGVNNRKRIGLKNGIQFYIESAKRRICTINKTLIPKLLQSSPVQSISFF